MVGNDLTALVVTEHHQNVAESIHRSVKHYIQIVLLFNIFLNESCIKIDFIYKFYFILFIINTTPLCGGSSLNS